MRSPLRAASCCPSKSRDGVPCVITGNATLSWFKRNILAREEGDGLVLSGYCPRVWLQNGKAIEAVNMPTHFGMVGYRVEARTGVNCVAGTLRFKFREPPTRIRLRLRHPEGLTPLHAAD